jgi:Capsule polysaccharide biosynthesis protein
VPLPDRDRLAEYALKGVHLALRQPGWAPEQRAARRLAAQAPPPGERHGACGAGADGEGRRVALLSPRDWAAHVHWEAMIGHALRLRGAKVTFLSCGGGLEVCDRANTWEAPPMPCRSCTRYVEDSVAAHGFPRVSLRAGWDGAEDDGWPELDGLALDDLGEVVADDGVPYGAMTEIPVKWFLMRTDLGAEPLAAPTWRAFLRSARRIARGVEAALDRLQPDVVLLVNGLFLFEAVAWEVCRRRGIDVVTYERGMIKETLVLRRGSPACLLDVSDQWPERRRRPLTAAEEARLDEYLDDRLHGRRTIDRFWGDAHFETTEARSGGRLVTLFTNLTWDSAVIGRERAFDSIQDWLATTVEVFAARPQDTLVVRIHPAEVKLPGKQTREPMLAVLEARVGTLPPNVRVVEATDPTSSYPLMEASDLGLVYTSTTGLELALRGVPVVVAGETHYRGKGFTIDVDSPEAFRASVAAALDDPAAVAPDRNLARRYAHLFFFEDPVRSPGVEEHVQGLVRLTVDSLDQLAPGADPDVDRICDAILNGDDLATVSAA